MLTSLRIRWRLITANCTFMRALAAPFDPTRFLRILTCRLSRRALAFVVLMEFSFVPLSPTRGRLPGRILREVLNSAKSSGHFWSLSKNCKEFWVCLALRRVWVYLKTLSECGGSFPDSCRLYIRSHSCSNVKDAVG